MAWPLIVAGALAAGSAAANYMGKRQDAQWNKDALEQIQKIAEQTSTANQGDINAYRNLVANTYGNGAAQYNTALAKFLNSPVYQNKDFSYGDKPGQTIESFMDPAANQRVDAAMQAIENSAASGGNRFSSDFINRVGAKQQAMASEEWEKAYNRLMQDRQQTLNEYNVNSQNKWNNYNATNARKQYAVDAYGNGSVRCDVRWHSEPQRSSQLSSTDYFGYGQCQPRHKWLGLGWWLARRWWTVHGKLFWR